MWRTIALPLLARPYVRKVDLSRIDPKHRPAFRTKLESAVELLRDRVRERLEQRQRQGDRDEHWMILTATANAHQVPLLTLNPKDFNLLADLVDVREPPR